MISLQEAEQEIREQKRRRGPYWNNIVGITLKMVADEHGVQAANGLIDKCGLKRLGSSKEPA